MDKEIRGKLKYLINKKKTLLEMCKALELKEHEVIGLIMLLKDEGELVDYINGEVIKLKKPATDNYEYIIRSKDGQIKFLALSDLHYGSKWDNPSLIQCAYELAEKTNCQFITNSGDVFEGDFHNKRPEHIYQVKALGMEQLDYVAEKHPKSELNTYFITGNHDNTFTKTCGADIGKMLADKRQDLIYLGADVGDLLVDKLKIRLRHGTGGGAYAKGYKLQKYCETLPTDNMPDIILQGHFHYSAFFKNRDIYCFNVPSLQKYTPYAQSMGLPQEMGFWIITCNVDGKGNVVSIIPELYQFSDKPTQLVRKR